MIKTVVAVLQDKRHYVFEKVPFGPIVVYILIVGAFISSSRLCDLRYDGSVWAVWKEGWIAFFFLGLSLGCWRYWRFSCWFEQGLWYSCCANRMNDFSDLVGSVLSWFFGRVLDWVFESWVVSLPARIIIWPILSGSCVAVPPDHACLGAITLSCVIRFTWISAAEFSWFGHLVVAGVHPWLIFYLEGRSKPKEASKCILVHLLNLLCFMFKIIVNQIAPA